MATMTKDRTREIDAIDDELASISRLLKEAATQPDGPELTAMVDEAETRQADCRRRFEALKETLAA
jgi:hypothetical protein